jgi:outer membrane murein-binding lipoprotein Lpp
MSKSKSTLNFVMVFSALLGLVFVIGCAGSAEKQEVSETLKLYSDAVSQYEAADNAHRAELKEKIESYKLKCSTMISDMELENTVTPQVINKLEKEYKEITKKYESQHS